MREIRIPIPDHLELPETIGECKILLRDALSDFWHARDPVMEYMARRYPRIEGNFYTDRERRAEKALEIAKRKRWANDLSMAMSDMTIKEVW